MRKGTQHSMALMLAAALCFAAAGFGGESDEQKEEFLRKATVVKRKGISVGINQTTRLTLSDGNLTHDAHFSTVDIYKPEMQLQSGREINFRDCYKFNVAAYKLDRLLGLNMIPVSVERKLQGASGAVTWWVDDVLMMEKDRYQKKVEPPDQDRWNRQMYRIRVFNELVYNTDANLGNLLITGNWDLWMIDFTRAFRAHKKLRGPGNLAKIDPALLERLRGLDAGAVSRELASCLRKDEIAGLLARRDLIVAHFDREIAAKGEGAVLSKKPER